jgi:hypothetical protein
VHRIYNLKKILTWCHVCAGAQRDLAGCSAILTSALELNVSLKPQQHEKFCALLLDFHGLNKQLLRTKQQHYHKPLKVPSFQLKFWIWMWNVTELRSKIYVNISLTQCNSGTTPNGQLLKWVTIAVMCTLHSSFTYSVLLQKTMWQNSQNFKNLFIFAHLHMRSLHM